MKLIKFLPVIFLFVVSTLFSNSEISVKAYGDILNPVLNSALSLSYDKNTVKTPDFLLLGQNWTEDSFSAGDTTASYAVNHAKIVFFQVRDSSISGTDSLFFGIKNTLSNGISLYSAVRVQSMNQTTITTYLAGSPLIPGDNTTAIYAWIPTSSIGSTSFTGTIYIARLNGVNSATPYAAVTRFVLSYE